MPLSRGYAGILGLRTIVALASVFSSAVAHSQRDSERPVVFVATEDDKKELKPLLDAILGHLVDQPVKAELHWMKTLPAALPEQLEIADELGRGHEAVAVFWLISDEDEVIHLCLTVPRSGRVVYRRLSRADGVLGEVLGMIVRTSVGSILAGGDGDVDLGESSTASVEEAPVDDGFDKGEEVQPAKEELGGAIAVSVLEAPPREKRRRLGIEAGYRFEAYSKQNPALSGISVGLSVRLGRHWAVTARTAFLLSELSFDSKNVALELTRHPSTLDFGFCKKIGEVEMGVAAGLGIDIVGEDVATTDALEPYGSRTEVIFFGVLELRGEVRLWSEFYAWVAAGGHVPFNPVEYVAQTNDDRITVSRAFAVRPVALVGLAYRVF